MEFHTCTLAKKVTKSQIYDGSMSQNELYMVYSVCAKLHALTKMHNLVIVYEFASLLQQLCAKIEDAGNLVLGQSAMQSCMYVITLITQDCDKSPMLLMIFIQ